MIRVTFRQYKAGVFAAPKAYKINADGREVGRIQETGRGSGRFFWYSMGSEFGLPIINTANFPAPSLRAAKVEVKHWVITYYQAPGE